MPVATLEKLSLLEEVNSGIAREHLEEWRRSAVNDEIILANVRTIYDQLEVDKLLNKRTKKMWRRPDDLVPCWCVTGIDPLTDMPTNQGIQIKANTPRTNDKGKTVKYEGARDAETAPLFLDTGKEGYWTNILEDVNQKIFICEGAKKAGALLSNNFTGVSIPGVTTCRKRGRLHQNLEIFAKVGRVFYLCFDNDILTKKPVQDALKGMGAVLKSFGSVVMVVSLPPGEFKGVDDYIAAFGSEAFQGLVDNAITIQEWVDEIKVQELEEEDTLPNSRLARHYNLVKEKWGDSLRYNTLKKQVELSGRELDEDEVRLIMALRFDIDITSTDSQTVVRSLAKEDEYSPVVEYLDEVANKYPDVDTRFLDDLARQYFGSDDPMHSTYFKKFLVAAAARARQPGCQLDTVFMLMSPKQGKMKSTFFRTLFGKEYFSDQLGTDITNKDEKMKISQYWCLEWAEFDAIYRKKDVSTLKNFITNPEDTFRAPYARKDARHPRPCVFVGTSNEKELLHDPTGDRRFWIIPVTIDKIPLKQVQADRDKLWAAADALYKSGHQFWLTDDEELIRAEQNKEYQGSSYWDEVIEQLWVESLRPNFLATETIIKRLGFENAKDMKPGDSNELTKSMTRLGFTKSKGGKRIDGIQKRGWVISEDSEKFDENHEKGCNGVAPLLDKDSSCYTPVTPPVTPVTDNQKDINSTVTPVTPPVTGVQQPEPSDSKGATLLHPSTAFLQEFSEKEKKLEIPNSTEVVQGDKFACPAKDDYYTNFDVCPLQFTLPSAFGEISVTAEPYQKIKSTNQSNIWLVFEYPDGRGAKSVKGLVDKKHLPKLAADCGSVQAWEKRQYKKWGEMVDNPNIKFRVRKLSPLEHEEYLWVENCTLRNVPSPPMSHNFLFKAESGEVVTAFSVDDFELMGKVE